ncbi:hypothetical protein, partial [Micromonospora noduli]|uniref:hypothetical protein n=1 Tax=Micromonospora noduli TaxID=709876 RepID=UPI001B8810ED
KGYPRKLCSKCCIRMFPIFIQEIETTFLIRMLYTTDLHLFWICAQYLGRKQKKATNFVYDIEINQNKKTVFHSSNEKIMPYRRLWKDILKENDAIAELNLKQILHDDFAFDLTIAIKNKLWYF